MCNSIMLTLENTLRMRSLKHEDALVNDYGKKSKGLQTCQWGRLSLDSTHSGFFQQE